MTHIIPLVFFFPFFPHRERERERERERDFLEQIKKIVRIYLAKL